MQHFRAGNPFSAELASVASVADFEHRAPDVTLVLPKEPLDVVAIDGLAAVEPKDAADRLQRQASDLPNL
jgi:hypothetical protein